MSQLHFPRDPETTLAIRGGTNDKAEEQSPQWDVLDSVLDNPELAFPARMVMQDLLSNINATIQVYR